jgi:hypothetical protein
MLSNDMLKPATGCLVDLFAVVGLKSLTPFDMDCDPDLSPIVDVVVFSPSKGERCPEGYTALHTSVQGHKAELKGSAFRRTIRVAIARANSGVAGFSNLRDGNEIFFVLVLVCWSAPLASLVPPPALHNPFSNHI